MGLGQHVLQHRFMNIAIVQPYENVGIEEYGLVNCSTSTFDLEIETA
jgi:hypothetical protein